jgi:hypothetical protein
MVNYELVILLVKNNGPEQSVIQQQRVLVKEEAHGQLLFHRIANEAIRPHPNTQYLEEDQNDTLYPHSRDNNGNRSGNEGTHLQRIRNLSELP